MDQTRDASQTSLERVSETVYVRLRPSIRVRLEQVAKSDGKALSEAARDLIEEALEAREQAA